MIIDSFFDNWFLTEIIFPLNDLEIISPLSVMCLWELTFFFFKYEWVHHLLFGKKNSLCYWILREHQNQEIHALLVFHKSKQQGYGQHHPRTPMGTSREVPLGGKRNFLQWKAYPLHCFLSCWKSRLGS